MAGLLLLGGCNQTALPPTEPDLGIGNFCSGSARVQMNGMTAESPAVNGRLEFLDCCDAAEFQVVSMQISQPLFFAWRHQVGTQPNLPATLDLLALPKGWGATLYTGCSPTAPGCTPTDLLHLRLQRHPHRQRHAFGCADERVSRGGRQRAPGPPQRPAVSTDHRRPVSARYGERVRVQARPAR